jgi:hypothetical protein
MDVHVDLNHAALTEKIKRRGAAGIARRADQLGKAGVTRITSWIDQELGPSSGRERPGMVSMRALNWNSRVESPGTLPISAIVFSTDIDSEPTRAKFWSLNNGRRGGIYLTTTSGHGDEGGLGRGRKGLIKEVEQPQVAGKEWVQRLGPYLLARARAGFIR